MNFYPALKYRFLSPFYDVIIRVLVPEIKIKSKAISFLKPAEGEKILDFGCGTGTLLALLNKKGINLKLYGLDPDTQLLRKCKEKLGVSAELIQLKNKELPFPDSAFDKIISTWVFHHLTDAEKIFYLKELKRVLSEQGMLIIADWGKPSGWVQQILSFNTRLFDNFSTFRSQVNGSFPTFMKEAGFNVAELGEEKTFLGTLKYCRLCSR